MKFLAAVLVAVTAAVVHQAAAQRDLRAEPAETASIRGRVLIADSDVPVRNARVSLSAEAGTAHDTVYTNSEGQFAFAGVAPGRYLATAWKSGLVEAKFGAHGFWDRHVSIVATAGAAIDGLQLSLAKGASISGRVFDEDGEPLVGMSIAVGRTAVSKGRLQFESAGFGTETDDLGEYRLGGLPAGTFVVSVFGWPPPSSQTAAAGTPGVPGPIQRPHTVFYPGTAFLTEARPIAVRPGDDVGAIDVRFGAAGATPRVSGRIVDPQGQPAPVSLAVLSDGRVTQSTMMSGVNMVLAASHEFTVPVMPGEYTLVAQGETGFALQHVSVGQEEITGIELVLAAGARISGRVVFDGTTPHPAGGMRVDAWSPEFLNGLGIRAGAGRDGQPAPVAPNGGFTLTGVFGEREIRVAQLPPGWRVKSISAGARDLLDVPITLKAGEDLRDVVIVLSDRSTKLTGLVHDARGTPVTDVSVLVFADDWRLLPGRARWIKPDHLGTFVASGLPAGTYLVALAAQVDDLRWSTAEYLNAFRDQATRVMLGDAGTTSITLRWSDQP